MWFPLELVMITFKEPFPFHALITKKLLHAVLFFHLHHASEIDQGFFVFAYKNIIQAFSTTKSYIHVANVSLLRTSILNNRDHN